MARGPQSATRQLSAAEQRALASFLAGRLPAGQLQAELARARDAAALAPAVAAAQSAAPAPAALRAA